MKVLSCPICGVVRAVIRRQKTCSYRCGQRLVKRERGEDFHRLAARKAGLATSLVTRRRTTAIWQQRFPGVDPVAARLIYRQGFNSGHRTGFSRGQSNGYRAGWAEALGERNDDASEKRTA